MSVVAIISALLKIFSTGAPFLFKWFGGADSRKVRKQNDEFDKALATSDTVALSALLSGRVDKRVRDKRSRRNT